MIYSWSVKKNEWSTHIVIIMIKQSWQYLKWQKIAAYDVLGYGPDC